jgi:hypothetical protein
VTVAWLAKVCNGIKQQRKVHCSFMRSVGKITVRINKQKRIKEYFPEIQRVANHAAYFTKECQGAENNTATVTCTYPESPLKDTIAA